VRITKKMLDHSVARLNECMDTVEGKNEYILSGAYGGWQLQRRNGHGMDYISSGFRPKRELFDFINAMVYGVRTYQDEQRIERKFPCIT
jgi:hypothetical protein